MKINIYGYFQGPQQRLDMGYRRGPREAALIRQRIFFLGPVLKVVYTFLGNENTTRISRENTVISQLGFQMIQFDSHVHDINVLVSFDAETVFKHGDKVTRGGVIIYDTGLVHTNIRDVPTIDEPAAARIAHMLERTDKEFTVQGMLDYAKENGVLLYGIPYFKLIKEFAQQINEASLSKLTRMINVMAVSASMAILDFDKEVLAESNSANIQIETKNCRNKRRSGILCLQLC